MGKVIQGLIFLALIAGVIVGAKMFVLDPMKKDKDLQDTKQKVTKLFNAGEHKKAIELCDALVKKYPKQKKTMDKRKFTIYIDWAGKSNDGSMEAERQASRAKREKNREDYDMYVEQKKAYAENVLHAVEKAEECGTIEKVHQQWRSIAYGQLGQKQKALDALKRQGTMD